MGYGAPLPEYSFYETVQAPDISWRRAKRAVATATDLHPFVTIEGWRTRPWHDGSQWRNTAAAIGRLTRLDGVGGVGEMGAAALMIMCV